MDNTFLKQLGLTAGESKTYLSLLRLGLVTTGPLSKQSGVSRSKLYFILDRLEKKGLVSHCEKNKRRYFQAVEPTKIQDYIQEKENEICHLKERFEQILPTLLAFQKENQGRQNVTVYQGLKGLITAHEHTYLKLRRGEVYYYLGISKNEPELHHLYWKRDHLRRIKAGICCKLLFNQNTPKEILKNRNEFKGCDARYMPTGIKTPAYFLIYKDTVMISISSESPIAIEVISTEIAASFKAYFNEFWKKAKKFEESS